jgi:hypothetical protein
VRSSRRPLEDGAKIEHKRIAIAVHVRRRL